MRAKSFGGKIAYFESARSKKLLQLTTELPPHGLNSTANEGKTLL